MASTSMKANFPQMIELNAEQQEGMLAVSQKLSDDGLEIIGESAGLKRALQQVETVAGTDSAVLILGETGTGKESIAHAIHSLSSRRQQSFVNTNCASI